MVDSLIFQKLLNAENFYHDEKLLDKDEKIVYRDNLKDAFQKFIDDYKSKLKKDKKLQEAFIRKFDSLCE